MTTFTEGRHAAEFVLSEANGHRSRENITIKSGAGVLVPGTVVGLVPGGTASSAAKSGGNTGTGTLTPDVTTPVRAGAKAGVYTVRFTAAATNNGTFRVEDPDGFVLGDVVMAAGAGVFDDDIKFAVADGGTDFVVGDGFDITVAISGQKYVPTDLTAADGSSKGAAIILYGVDATSADVAVSAIARSAEVNGKCLTYHTSVSDDPKKAVKAAELAAFGIIVR